MIGAPDTFNPNWKKDKFELAKQMVDFGVSLLRSSLTRAIEIQKNYRGYHGVYTTKEKTALTNVHGKTSATELIPHYQPKVKIDQLLGESLEVGFSAEVDTINPLEKEKKNNEALRAKGRSFAKPLINSVKDQGIDIYNQMSIPDSSEDSEFEIERFRTRNEFIGQKILNEKIKDSKKNDIYYYLFASGIFSSEIFSFGDIGPKGNTQISWISPEQMIYPDNYGDLTLNNAPIIGHWNNMYFPEIVRAFNLKKGSIEYKEVEELFKGGMNGASSHSSQIPIPENENKYTTVNDGLDLVKHGTIYSATGLVATVYYFQWRYYKEVSYTQNVEGKIEFLNLTKERDRKTKDDKRSGAKTKIFERIYQGACIAGCIYLGFKDVDDFVRMPDSEGQYYASYDYTATLMKTFGGRRTPFAKVLIELGTKLDQVRWMLYRELKKSKSNAIYLDRAFAETRSKSSILYDLEDAGVLDINSKEAFDNTGRDITDGKQVVGAIASGSTSTIIGDLISAALDIERVMNEASGMNDARKGTELATTTATANQSNLQASRSVTLSNFHFTESHMQRALTHILQKTKQRITNGSKEHNAYLSSDDITYIENSHEFAFDDFEARVVGGRRSQQIFAELNELIKSEVASGKRSSADFVEIKEQDSLIEAKHTLRKSDERLEEIANRQQEREIESKQQLNENTNIAHKEDREDAQAHDAEISNEDNAIKVEIAKINASAKESSQPEDLKDLLGNILIEQKSETK